MKIPIETGRWHNIPVEEPTWYMCNENIGDEIPEKYNRNSDHSLKNGPQLFVKVLKFIYKILIIVEFLLLIP